MKIIHAKVETVHWPIVGGGAARGRSARSTVLVELVGDTGLVGLGEAAPLPGVSRDSLKDAEAALVELTRCLPIELDIGARAGNERLLAVVAEVTRFTPSPAARFALETALFDLVGQELGLPAAALIAKTKRRDPAALAVPLPCAVVVDDPAAARRAVLAGARTLKIKVGATGDVDRVVAIHRAAPEATLRLDANRSWPHERGLAMLHAFTELPIEFIEEPTANTLALLGELTAIPLALDESLATISDEELDRALAQPSLGALVIKPTLVGGLIAARDLVARAHAAGKRAVITHALEGPIGTAACAAVSLAIGDVHTAAGLAPHAGLAGWPVTLPFLAPTHLTFSLGPGLGLERTNPPPTRLDEAVRITELAAHVERSAERAPNHLAVVTRTGSVRFDELARAGAGRNVLVDQGTGGTATSGSDLAHPLLATPSLATLRAIHVAFATGMPLGLLHPKLAAAELDRQRAILASTRVPDGSAVILFTSGSTGTPRGVVLSRTAIDAAIAMSEANLGWRADDRWLLALPMAHAGGLSVVLRCRAARVPVVLLEGDFDRARCVAALADCTLASLVPTQLAVLLEDPAWRSPTTLRAVIIGGAAATPALLAAAAARGVPILTSYGLTETFGQIATAPLGHAGDPHAPLILLPGVTVTGGTRAAPGRLCVTSPSLATQYLDGTPIAPALTTADLGFVEDNAVTIVGRVDDVIITGGENVHPNEIEAILAATPGVLSVLVFGVPDDRWGQRVAAALAIDTTFDEAHARSTWRVRLAAHQLPRELATVAALPQLANGKLDRRGAVALARRPLDWR